MEAASILRQTDLGSNPAFIQYQMTDFGQGSAPLQAYLSPSVEWDDNTCRSVCQALHETMYRRVQDHLRKCQPSPVPTNVSFTLLSNSCNPTQLQPCSLALPSPLPYS